MSDSEFETLDYSQRFSGQKWKQRVSSVIINHFQFQIIVKNWANSDVLFFQVTRIPSYNGNELIHSENAIFYDAINLTYYEVTNYFLFFFFFFLYLFYHHFLSFFSLVFVSCVCFVKNVKRIEAASLFFSLRAMEPDQRGMKFIHGESKCFPTQLTYI